MGGGSLCHFEKLSIKTPGKTAQIVGHDLSLERLQRYKSPHSRVRRRFSIRKVLQLDERWHFNHTPLCSSRTLESTPFELNSVRSSRVNLATWTPRRPCPHMLLLPQCSSHAAAGGYPDLSDHFPVSLIWLCNPLGQKTQVGGALGGKKK